jgi:hypothetical protein
MRSVGLIAAIWHRETERLPEALGGLDGRPDVFDVR